MKGCALKRSGLGELNSGLENNREGGRKVGGQRVSRAQRYSHKLGGGSVLSAEVVLQLWRNDSSDRKSRLREGTLDISSCLCGCRGEPGCCDPLQHGMQPLYAEEA